MHTKSKKRILNYVMLSFILILLTLIICELSMRIVGKKKNIDFRLYAKELKNSDRLPGDLFIEDDILGRKLRPNVQVLATTSDFSVIYSINSKGLRDKEYDYANSQGKVRILAFGDSFTFGEGIPYHRRFTDISEDYFPNLEIINFEVPGYGLDQILLYIATEGIKYKPDYIMLFFNHAIEQRYSTNTIKDNSVILDDVIFKEPAGDISTAYLNRNDDFFKCNNNFIIRNSYFLSFLKYHVSLLKLRGKLQQYDKKLWGNVMEEHKKRNNFQKSAQIQNRTKLLIKKLTKFVERIILR